MIKKLLTITIINLFCLSSIESSNEKGPSLPSLYKQNYTEKLSYWLLRKGETNGTIYSDKTTMRERVDKMNGNYDKLCGSVFWFKNTPCSHYVNEGKRYVHFPEKNYCCMCCEDKQGCGMTKNTLMVEGEKINEFEKDEISYEVWKNGDIEMTFLKENKILVSMKKKNEDWSFDSDSLTLDFDSRLLDLPEICDPNKKCGLFTLCSTYKTEQI